MRENHFRKERVNNPFHELLVTELIANPTMYEQMFSQEILVGEALELFQPVNAIVSGPQGSGKTMLLNLVRLEVLAEFIRKQGKPPGEMEHLQPYFGIFINLVLSDFCAFGRRSVAKAKGSSDPALDCASAVDFFNTFLFVQFLTSLKFLGEKRNAAVRHWLGLTKLKIDSKFARTIAMLDCWSGYYSSCHTFEDLIAKANGRIKVWRDFLNTNIDDIPDDIWRTKTFIGPPSPLRALAELIRGRSKEPRLSLFVVVDQYEVLPELNATFGPSLQRVINSAIKARDPLLFYKLGARSYDWGRELKVWGSDSRIEVQRDYVVVDLSRLLLKTEMSGRPLFPRLAVDAALKRLKANSYDVADNASVTAIFGNRKPFEESRYYFKNQKEKIPSLTLRGLPDPIQHELIRLCGVDPPPLLLRLAAAWALQQINRKVSQEDILAKAKLKPWMRHWWYKERVETALLQLASLTNSQKSYSGWRTILLVSGYNITAFLLVMSEIWDWSAKMGINPLKGPIPDTIQSEGIHQASKEWRQRDRNEPGGGEHRYEVLGRLGPAIHAATVRRQAISNPGHSGFSLRDTDLKHGGPNARMVEEFLKNAVNWAIFEEREHTSKNPEESSRRKWYLHPLFSPEFAIPYTRVKEPVYIDGVEIVYRWFFTGEPILFSRKSEEPGPKETTFQMHLLEEHE